MKVRKIGFVAVPVTDLPRARGFYEGVLGLTPAEEMMGGMWIEYEVGGDTLAIANVGDDWRPSDQGSCAALEMDDFEAAIEKLRAAPTSFAAEPFETPCCHMAVVQDPDGNKIIIHKLKPENERKPCP